MKSLFKKFRLFVAALLVGAAVFGLAGCTPPNSGNDDEPKVVYTEAVYKAEAGDWYKVFYEDGKPVKIYTCSVSYDASWNATRTISVETAKEKTYDELVVLDANVFAQSAKLLMQTDIMEHLKQLMVVSQLLQAEKCFY